jgi:hypothetical protein
VRDPKNVENNLTQTGNQPYVYIRSAQRRNPQDSEQVSERRPDPENKKPGKWHGLKLQDRCMILLTSGLLLVAGGTAYILLGQFNTMSEQTQILASQAQGDAVSASLSAVQIQKQLSIAQEQAQAAQDSVKAVQRQMRQDQRAWITIQPGKTQIEDNKVITAAFQIENSGKTLAKKFHSYSVLVMLKKDEEPDFSYDPKRVKALEIRSGIVLPHLPEGRLPNVLFRNGIPVILDSTVHEELRKRILLLIAYGRVSYWDIFGTSHWMTYCLSVGLPDAVPPVGLDTVSKKCTDYGNADND